MKYTVFRQKCLFRWAEPVWLVCCGRCGQSCKEIRGLQAWHYNKNIFGGSAPGCQHFSRKSGQTSYSHIILPLEKIGFSGKIHPYFGHWFLSGQMENWFCFALRNWSFITEWSFIHGRKNHPQTRYQQSRVPRCFFCKNPCPTWIQNYAKNISQAGSSLCTGKSRIS